MPRLGLGLGLSRGTQLQSFAQLVKSAGGVLYLDARKADGSAPLTGNESPWVDLTKNSNDGTLTNFAGSASSGWQSSPNVLRFDGVDDFVQFADTASLDITEAPLAIGVTFKSPVDSIGFILSKNLTGTTDVQYGLLTRTGRTIEFYKNGVSFSQFVVDSSNYVNVIFYWDGLIVRAYENGLFKLQQDLTTNLISSGTLKIGKRDVNLALFEGDIATVTIYTGSDINKILKAEAKISAEYLALNP